MPARPKDEKLFHQTRLYYPRIGGIVLAVSMFIFAWTARPTVHWIVSFLALSGVNFGVYCVFLGVL
jgi:hypothetical protein